MDLQRTLRYMGEMLAFASVATVGALGAATLAAQPPRPNSLMGWLLFIVTSGFVAAALVLAIVLALPLARAGYPKTSAGILPAKPLFLTAVTTAVGSLGLAQFGVFTGRDVTYLLGAGLLSGWLGFLRRSELSEPDA